jgi:Protein of unknown function (DUF3106)
VRDRAARLTFAPTLLAVGLSLAALSFVPRADAQPQPSPLKRAAESSGPSWQSLSTEQRSALAPLQNDWSSIDAPRKAKWLDIAGRYPKMAPEDQKLLQARMSEWSRLSPSERARARLNFQEVKQLPHQERQDKWQAYQALPESQRQALASKAATPGVKPAPEAGTKRNIVVNPSLSPNPSRAVAPTVVQAAPGATTTLVTRQPAPPAHQQAGLPKIAATPGFVDRKTLLPTRGPQGAGVRAGASAPASQP